LSFVGLATVKSASSELGGDYFSRQALWLILGCAILLLAFLAFDYHALVDAAPAFYAIGLVLLVLVLFVGQVKGGARSWLSFGPISGQPSEIAKLTTALLLCRYLSSIQRPVLGFKQIVTAGILAAVPMLLIALERDMGGAAMIVPMLAGMLLVTGVAWRQVVIALLLAVALGAGLWNFGMHDYQKSRILSFLSPGEDPLGAGYQVRQSKIAVGSGQWQGRGYGQGTQSQLRFLPERHTDFIMAVLAEEWGFLGVLVVLALYSFYVYSAAVIATRSRDRAGVLLVVALLAVITFHTLYNTAMVVGLLPITGIPLPFLSYGGSFMLVNFIATGLILNVDYRRYVNR
jgi:rod shape determining protein RodA